MTISQTLNRQYSASRSLPPYGVQGGRVFQWGKFHAGPSDGYSPPPDDESTDSKGRHIGLDVVATPPGGMVYAVAPGKVRQIIRHNTSEGDQLIVEFWRYDLPGNLENVGAIENIPAIGDDHVFMLIDHLANVRVSRGQSLQRGQPIANVSTTDPTAGKVPHVHYGAWWSIDALNNNDFSKAIDPARAISLLGGQAPSDGYGKDAGNMGPGSVLGGIADQGLSQIGSAITSGLLGVVNLVWGYLVMRPLDFLSGFCWELAYVLYDDADLAAGGNPRQAMPGSKNHPLHLGPFQIGFLPNLFSPLQQDRFWIIMFIGLSYYSVYKRDQRGQSYTDRLGDLARKGGEYTENIRQQRVRRQPKSVSVPANVTRSIATSAKQAKATV